MERLARGRGRGRSRIFAWGKGRGDWKKGNRGGGFIAVADLQGGKGGETGRRKTGEEKRGEET